MRKVLYFTPGERNFHTLLVIHLFRPAPSLSEEHYWISQGVPASSGTQSHIQGFGANAVLRKIAQAQGKPRSSPRGLLDSLLVDIALRKTRRLC